MKVWKAIFGIVLALSSAGAAPLWAQEGGDEKPKRAARVLLPLPDLSGEQQDSDQNDQTMQPDHGPVSGVQAGTLGTSALRHSYWATGVQYGSTAQNNVVASGNTSGGWTATNYATGNVSLLEAWPHSLFGANYTGGGSFSSNSVQGNGQFHQLSSSLEIDQRRWQALVIEQLSYLPQSSFGFGGSTGLAVPGIGGALSAPLPGLQNSFVPGQSIFSVLGSRYSSTSAVQLAYSLSPRVSVTAAVVHGLLRFTNAGNIGSDTETLNAGYNYAITHKDSVGVIYRFTAFHYPGIPQALGDQLFQFVYGRRVTGRLALNLSGGPDVTNFRVPMNGTNQSISGGGGASLSYAFAKSSFKVAYAHGIGSGSGLFSGSRSDQVTVDWSRPLSRAWNWNLNSGYARNSTIVSIKGLPSPTYNSVLEGMGLNRPLGRSARFAFGYQAQIQTSSGIACNTPGCQDTQVTHQIQMSFQWNAPPQVLR